MAAELLPRPRLLEGLAAAVPAVQERGVGRMPVMRAWVFAVAAQRSAEAARLLGRAVFAADLERTVARDLRHWLRRALDIYQDPLFASLEERLEKSKNR